MKPNELVDALLDNNTSKIKLEGANKLVDTYLDEMCGKKHMKEEDECVGEGCEEAVTENAYQEYFKSMLAKRGIKSPNELSDPEKKKFFAKVNAGWTKNK